MAIYISSILFVFETFHRNFSIPRTHSGPKGLNSLELIKEKFPHYFFKRTKYTAADFTTQNQNQINTLTWKFI